MQLQNQCNEWHKKRVTLPQPQKSSLWPKTKSICLYIWDYLDIWYWPVWLKVQGGNFPSFCQDRNGVNGGGFILTPQLQNCSLYEKYIYCFYNFCFTAIFYNWHTQM